MKKILILMIAIIMMTSFSGSTTYAAYITKTEVKVKNKKNKTIKVLKKGTKITVVKKGKKKTLIKCKGKKGYIPTKSIKKKTKKKDNRIEVRTAEESKTKIPAITEEIDVTEVAANMSIDDINDTVPVLDGRLGDHGRLYIPTVGISVALFNCDSGADANYITDCQDSAASISRDGRKNDPSYIYDPIIADHTEQGFCGLYDVIPNYTKAYIYDEYGNVTTYVCTKKFNGHNTLSGICDWNWNDVTTWGNDYLMYTCNECWQNVTVTFWQKIIPYDQMPYESKVDLA